MAYRPDNGFERDITDIIPERFDADADSREARSAYRWRNYLAVAMGWPPSA